MHRPSQQPAKRPRLGERTMLACITCKQKKLKCDGQTPKCQNCVKSGRDCLVEDPATGLHRPRDYMQSLEARVAYLEGLLQEVRPDVASDHLVSDYRPRDSRINNDDSTINTADFGDRPVSELQDVVDGHSSDTQADVGDLSSDVALLCVSAAGREPLYFGPSSALSFARVFSSALRLSKGQGGSKRGTDEQTSSHSGSRVQIPLRFPPPSVSSLLSQAYFNNIHPQYPFLHHPTFRDWEDECTEASQTGNLQTISKTSIFFVLMVYAIGSLILNSGQYSSAEAYYSMALDHIEEVIHLDTLESVQAVLCCAVYSIRSPVGASIWKLSGMAIRHCIELGYHRSTRRFRPHSDQLTTEMSKRVFWVAYDIDRAAAFALGRPVGISDEVIDVELPLDIDDSDIRTTNVGSPPNLNQTTPTNMTGAIHNIKLRLIWSKISDNLYPAVSKGRSDTAEGHGNTMPAVANLRRELEEWRASIPNQLNYTGADPRSVFASKEWFHLAYCHSILLLYRHYLTAQPSRQTCNVDTIANCDLQSAIEEAFIECTARSRDMCLGYRRLYQSSQVQYTWGSLHILFLAGLTYLHCLWSSEKIRATARRVDVINTCTSCTMVLVIIAERWSIATSYRDIFEVLAEKTIAMICGDTVETRDQPQHDTIQSGSPSAMSHLAHLDQQIMNLGDILVPDESEWLVQDLLQGFRDQQTLDASQYQQLADMP